MWQTSSAVPAASVVPESAGRSGCPQPSLQWHVGVGTKGYAAGEGIRGQGQAGAGHQVQVVGPETPDWVGRVTG